MVGEDDVSRLFVVYHTETDQYYGVSTIAIEVASNLSPNLGIWVYDVDNLVPWTIKRLKSLCKIPLHQTFGEDEDIIIVVPITHNECDFTCSIPITCWHGE